MKLLPCFSSDSCEAEIGLAKCFYSVIRSMSRCSKFSYEWGNGLIFRPSPGCLRTAYSKTIWMTVFSWGSTDVICDEKCKETKGFAFDTVSIFNLRKLENSCLLLFKGLAKLGNFAAYTSVSQSYHVRGKCCRLKLCFYAWKCSLFYPKLKAF